MSSDEKNSTEKLQEVSGLTPSSAEQEAAAKEIESSQEKDTDKSKSSTSGSSTSKNGSCTVGYFLANFVLPDAKKSQMYVERLNASNNILGSYGGNDSNLAFVGYGLLFVSEVLKYASSLVPSSPSPKVAAGVGGGATARSAILPWLSTPAGHALLQRFASKATSLVGPTRILSNLISDIRIFNRLWGLVPLSVWAVDTWAQPPQDPVLRGIAYTQVVANLLYQPLENVAYLAMHQIIPTSVISDRAQLLLWIYSCYLWALHVVLDLVRLYREAQLQRQGKLPKNDFRWYQHLIINLSYLPLTVHWSLEQGCLNDMTVGFLGSTAALASIYPKWKSVFK